MDLELFFYTVELYDYPIFSILLRLLLEDFEDNTIPGEISASSGNLSQRTFALDISYLIEQQQQHLGR